MRNLPVVGALVLVVAAAGTDARAVDLVNQDDVTQTAIVDDGNKLSEVIVNPGQTIRDICPVCYIGLDETFGVEAEGGQQVIIRGGRVELAQ